MKKFSLLAFGLASSLVGTSVYANTGTINFEGKITSGTCPIEVVNPNDGTVGGLVKLPTIQAESFKATGQELGVKKFMLRIVDGATCGFGPGDEVSVTFNGTPDSTGNYYAVSPSADAATGVAIAITDYKGTLASSGAESSRYTVNETGSTDLLFSASYRSTAASVTPGTASTDANFIVNIL